MAITLHHCEDVTEHAQRLEGWQQEFDQIDEGRFSGDIIDLNEKGIRLFRESANLGISQSMHCPDDQWHLIIPNNCPNDPLFRIDAITVLPRCEQFRSISPASYDMLVLSVDRSRYSWLERDEKRLRALKVPTTLLSAVRQQWQEMTAYLKTAQVQGKASDSVQRTLVRQLEEGIELLLGDCSRSPKCDGASYRTRRYIVDRCHALTRAQPDNPPSLMKLCHQLKISRRTLQYSFQAETGQSPVHYLRALRLNAVRRSLLRDPTLRLADAAAAHGFFHQSYFSREYRRLFHELPSRTREQAKAQ